MSVQPPRRARTASPVHLDSGTPATGAGALRRVRWLLVAATGLLLIVLLFATSGRDEPESLGLRPAPPIDVERLDEPGRLRLADYQGIPVVVNFWASWCTPCRQEMPELDALAKKFGPRLAVIGINMQDRPEDARALLDELGVGYPIGIDSESAAVLAYDVTVVPSTLFITADGRFAGRASGKPSSAELDDLIKLHFGLS